MNNLHQIIDGCLRQDRKSQHLFYLRYYGCSLKIVFRYVDTYDQAKEVTNKGFLRIFNMFTQCKAPDQNKPEDSLPEWIRDIMVHTAVDYMKHREMSHPPLPPETGIWDMEEQNNTEASQLSYKELIIRLKLLPWPWRLIFNLYAIEGYPMRKVRKLTGMNKNNVYSNLSYARRQLQMIPVDQCR